MVFVVVILIFEGMVGFQRFGDWGKMILYSNYYNLVMLLFFLINQIILLVFQFISVGIVYVVWFQFVIIKKNKLCQNRSNLLQNINILYLVFIFLKIISGKEVEEVSCVDIQDNYILEGEVRICCEVFVRQDFLVLDKQW